MGRVTDDGAVRLDDETPCTRCRTKKVAWERMSGGYRIEHRAFVGSMLGAQSDDRIDICFNCRPNYDHLAGDAATSEKPSTFQPSTPPIIFFTSRPSRASLSAALSAPLQCGPLQ